MTPRGLLAMCSMGLAACAAAPGPPPAAAPAAAPGPAASLTGTRWVGVVEGAEAGTLPRIEFVTQGRLTGYSGCNMMSGSWRMEGDAIHIGPVATTKRMCAGPGGEIERRFLAALGGSVARAGDKLVFIGPTGTRFEFTPAQAS